LEGGTLNGESFNGDEPVVPKLQKGKGAFLVVASVMFVVSIVGLVVLLVLFGKSSFSGNDDVNLPKHEYTSDVVEHIKTEKPSKAYYTDKTELYNDSQKSCVTVITSIKPYDQTQKVSLGSGFVVSKEGYIVTNAHVIEGGNSFKVRFYDGTEADALLVGKDTACDIAVMKIHKSDSLVPASIGDSNSVRIGDFAMAVGTPSREDFFGTMTFGVISGKERKLSVKNSDGQTVKTMMLLQTDATLNPGNSGGPLFNMYGQVIGINTMKLSQDYEGIGFAIPSSGAVKIINSLISTGKADYTDSEYVKGGAQLGITGVTIDDEEREKLGFPEDTPEGVLVYSIKKKSSAYKAGLSVFDVICEFKGKKVTTIEQLIEELEECYPNEEVTVKIYRVDRGSDEWEYFTYTFKLDSVEG
jgi:S1-C subfamily serine protease